VAKVNIFIVNNLATLRCRISRPGVKSIANELSGTATNGGRSGSSLALHVIAGMREDMAMAQDFERSHVSTGLGDCGGIAMYLAPAMLQKGQSTIKISRLHRVPV
jgi:hypothetical protein